jgi:hypothetical protein
MNTDSPWSFLSVRSISRQLPHMPLLIGLVTVILGAAFPAIGWAGTLTARVRTIDGVPRLVVNGVPITPRVFWGGPGSSAVPIKAGEQSLSFTFYPMQDEPKIATLHFRFQHIPSKVLLETVHLVDLTTGADVIPETRFGDQAAFAREWAYWPANSPSLTGSVNVIAPDANGSGGGILIAQHAPAQGQDWSDTHVHHNTNLALYAAHRYRLDISLNSDVPTFGFFSFYRPGARYVMVAATKDPFGDQIKLAAKAGVNIVSFETDMPWPKPGETMDTTDIDTISQFILHTNPNALILPRIYVRPPAWWLDSHPEDEMKWIGTDTHMRTATVASQAFRADASVQLAALIKHLESQFGDHMLGYHIAGQNSDEWFYVDSWGPDWNGYSMADTNAFRQWLTEKYASDSALQNAWHDNSVTLAAATVPTPKEREGSGGDLRDPATLNNVIDFTLFQQRNMADCVCDLAHVVRTTTNGKKLCVFFYGYAYEFGPAQNGPANAGHYGMRRVLSSPDIDAIASPWSYNDRGLTGTQPIMTTADSIALAGKLYIAEDDTATQLSTGDAPGSTDRAKDAVETNKILLRNSAEMSLRNLGTWWMDLGATGWFDDPAYWAMLGKFAPVAQSQLENARPFHPEIASVVDEKSVPLFSWHGRAGPLLTDSRAAIGRAGAPYGQYLQDDITAGHVHAKLYLFLSSYRLASEQRRALLKATAGSTKIWCYMPGYYDGDSASLSAVHDLTGFAVKLVSPDQGRVTPTPAGVRLGLTDRFGSYAPLKPALAVTDATPDETLATYPDGSTAVAIRKTSSGISIFDGAAQLTPQLVRLAAKAAGVHLYADNEAAVYANGPFVAIHATKDGPVSLDTGKKSEVEDVMSGEKLGMGPSLTIPMTAGDTRMLKF